MDATKLFKRRIETHILFITLIETVFLLFAWRKVDSFMSPYEMATSAAIFGASRWINTNVSEIFFTTRIFMIMFLCACVSACRSLPTGWFLLLALFRIAVSMSGVATCSKMMRLITKPEIEKKDE